MPIQKIEVNEFTCLKCGWKWINRVNGKDGAIPERCAKCKRGGWNGGEKDVITYEENGLRRRIKGLRQLYCDGIGFYFNREKDCNEIAKQWPEDLAERFLSLKPRPTINELRRVIYPKGLTLTPLDSQNQFTRRGYVPDPYKPGWLKYDNEEYVRLRKQEAFERLKAMQQIIESRSKVQSTVTLQ